MTTPRKRSREQTQGLIFLWISTEGRKSLTDLLLRLQQHNKNFKNTAALSQCMKKLINQNLIIKVSEHPNPEYDLHPGRLTP